MFFTCKIKGADQLYHNRTADQRLCFCYIDSTIALLPRSEISSPYLLWLFQPCLCQTWRQVFSRQVSNFCLLATGECILNKEPSIYSSKILKRVFQFKLYNYIGNLKMRQLIWDSRIFIYTVCKFSYCRVCHFKG